MSSHISSYIETANDAGSIRQDGEPALMHRSLVDRPLPVASAYGSYLTLLSGDRILDACAGAAVAVIGHGNERVKEAIMTQVSSVSYVHTGIYTTSSAEKLAEIVVGHHPFGLTKAFFVSSGSEAMDAALKLARQYHVENGQPQRNRLVARRRAYHGTTIGGMSVGSFVARKAPYVGALLLDTVSFVSPAYGYRGQWDTETEESYALRLVEELDAEFQSIGPEKVGAFIAETVGGATAGCITPPRGYFEGVRRVCDKYGILLILDEIMCGSGRTGTYFAFEQDGDVRPDLVTIGKGLGGGYLPIAGILVQERVVEVLRKGTASFNHGQTYQAHPVSCAAALAVQKVLHEENLIEKSVAKGKILEQLLKETFENATHVGNIRGRGLFWGVEFVQDKSTKQPFPASFAFGIKVQEEALRLGVAVYPGRGTADGLIGDHVLLSPPLTISEDEMKIAVEVLKTAYETIVKSASQLKQ